jgi:hypothetical protein
MADLDTDDDGFYDGADVIDCPEPGAALLHDRPSQRPDLEGTAICKRRTTTASTSAT